MTENLSNFTGDELRAKAAEQFANREESFERCDTDGFLSQWASGLTANLYRTQAGLADNGGQSEFWGLFDLDGNRVAAKMIDGKYGVCWAFCDENGKFTGKFLPFCQAAGDFYYLTGEEAPTFTGFSRELNRKPTENEAAEMFSEWVKNQAAQIKRAEKRVASWEKKHGFSQRMEAAPAKAYIAGNGHGLSGSAWVATKRTDGGFPPGSKVVR